MEENGKRVYRPSGIYANLGLLENQTVYITNTLFVDAASNTL